MAAFFGDLDKAGTKINYESDRGLIKAKYLILDDSKDSVLSAAPVAFSFNDADAARFLLSRGAGAVIQLSIPSTSSQFLDVDEFTADDIAGGDGTLNDALLESKEDLKDEAGKIILYGDPSTP